jgi:hypothetical protein
MDIKHTINQCVIAIVNDKLTNEEKNAKYKQISICIENLVKHHPKEAFRLQDDVCTITMSIPLPINYQQELTKNLYLYTVSFDTTPGETTYQINIIKKASCCAFCIVM